MAAIVFIAFAAHVVAWVALPGSKVTTKVVRSEAAPAPIVAVAATA